MDDRLNTIALMAATIAAKGGSIEPIPSAHLLVYASAAHALYAAVELVEQERLGKLAREMADLNSPGRGMDSDYEPFKDP